LTSYIGGVSNITGANAGYGNFTNLTANLPYGSNTILFSAALKEQLTQNFESMD
jgi:hypothetical protein